MTTDGKLLRLHIPILLEEINQQQCSCRKRQGKLLVILEKRDASKQARDARRARCEALAVGFVSCRWRWRSSCRRQAARPPPPEPWHVPQLAVAPLCQWYELRKTKGIGDSEYAKIVPDSGEAVEFTL